MKYSEMKVNDIYKEKFVATDEKVRTFAATSGDNNPLHLDDEFAKKTIFKQRIAHGMLVASFISKVLGRDFPGDGTIYMQQEVKFTKPVYINEEVEVEVEVLEKRDDKKIIKLRTDVFNSKGDKVVKGNATVMKPE